MFLGKIPVTYRVREQADYLPGRYRITSIDVTYEKEGHYTTTGDTICGTLAEIIREGKAESICVTMER